jgi:hypothetical protein
MTSSFEINYRSGRQAVCERLLWGSCCAFAATNTFRICVIDAPSHEHLFRAFEISTCDLFCQGYVRWDKEQRLFHVYFKGDDYCLWDAERETAEDIRAQAERVLRADIGAYLSDKNARPFYKPMSTNR